jgi:hypothetical protein
MNCPYCLTELEVYELEYPETDDILDTVTVFVRSTCPKCERAFWWKIKYTNPESSCFEEDPLLDWYNK